MSERPWTQGTLGKGCVQKNQISRNMHAFLQRRMVDDAIWEIGSEGISGPVSTAHSSEEASIYSLLKSESYILSQGNSRISANRLPPHIHVLLHVAGEHPLILHDFHLRNQAVEVSAVHFFPSYL
jgi:hypothetical protein